MLLLCVEQSNKEEVVCVDGLLHDETEQLLGSFVRSVERGQMLSQRLRQTTALKQPSHQLVYATQLIQYLNVVLFQNLAEICNIMHPL